jgi:SAM-dependent methyltransferase
MDTYVDAFNSFLSVTDEKEVLANAIIREMKRYDVRSLLDVGAGSGELSGQLAAVVDEYLAIEMRAQYVEQIRKSGLVVNCGKWPVRLDKQFDAVLMSHLLDGDDDLTEMLEPALDVLRVNGVLMLVLHQVAGSDWAALRQSLNLAPTADDGLAESAEDTLGRLRADTQVQSIGTAVRTPDIEVMIRALDFVATSGDAQKQTLLHGQRRQILTEVLNSRYRRSDGVYEFPFQHVLISARPPSRAPIDEGDVG